MIKNNNKSDKTKISKRAMAFMAVAMMLYMQMTALASNSVTTTLTNTNNLMFDVVAAAGVLALIGGFIFFLSSFFSHDTGQRVGGIMGFVGGLLMYFLKDILVAIGIHV